MQRRDVLQKSGSAIVATSMVSVAGCADISLSAEIVDTHVTDLNDVIVLVRVENMAPTEQSGRLVAELTVDGTSQTTTDTDISVPGSESDQYELRLSPSLSDRFGDSYDVDAWVDT